LNIFKTKKKALTTNTGTFEKEFTLTEMMTSNRDAEVKKGAGPVEVKQFQLSAFFGSSSPVIYCQLQFGTFLSFTDALSFGSMKKKRKPDILSFGYIHSNGLPRFINITPGVVL
jgi:hypothetical protein